MLIQNNTDELSDVYNAKLFTATFESELKYSPQSGCWYKYDGVIWQNDHLRYVMQHAIECTRNMLLDSAGMLINAAKTRDNEKRDLMVKKSESLTKHAKSSQQKNRLDAMIGLASTDAKLSVNQSEFDSDDMLLALQNGVFDLARGVFRDANPSDMLTKQTGTEYVGADYDKACEVWMNFLEMMQPDPSVRVWLQRFAGYCLTGRIDEQIFTVFHGGGSNGKTVFIETLKRVLGSYATQAQFETFCERSNDSSIRNDIARLDKIRLVVATEGADGSRLDESLIKQITGGDEITARFLHKEYFTFTPRFKIVLVTNHKPVITGTDLGIWRRVVLVPWLVTIPNAKKDKRLWEKLNLERSGILAWALDGLADYLKHGLELPKVLIDANSEYRNDSDLIGLWIDDCCHVANHHRVSSNDLYLSYSKWANSSGHRAMSQKTLGDKLSERGYIKNRTTNGRGWDGLKLK
jgi:putative DNA primase/helicase